MSEQSRNDFEVNLVHAECEGCTRSLVGPAIIMAVMTVTPIASISKGAHLAAFISLLGALSVMAIGVYTLKQKDRSSILRHAAMIGISGQILRTAMHAAWIIGDNDGIFGRAFTLYVLPVSAARQSYNMKSFKVYLLMHILLCIYRFSDDLEKGGPWLVSVFILSVVAFEVASQRDQFRATRLLLDMSHRRLESMAGATLKTVVNSFCDAGIVCDSNLILCESSQRLDALTGRRTQPGRCLTDFIDYSDRDEVSKVIKDFESEVQHQEDAREDSRVETSSPSMYMKSIQVHLLNEWSAPVPAHMFISSVPDFDESKLLIGISEMWQRPRMAKGSKETKESIKATKFNIDTGKWDLAFPQFGKQDPVKHTSELDASLNSDMKASGFLAGKARADSPRPSGIKEDVKRTPDPFNRQAGSTVKRSIGSGASLSSFTDK